MKTTKKKKYSLSFTYVFLFFYRHAPHKNFGLHNYTLRRPSYLFFLELPRSNFRLPNFLNLLPLTTSIDPSVPGPSSECPIHRRPYNYLVFFSPHRTWPNFFIILGRCNGGHRRFWFRHIVQLENVQSSRATQPYGKFDRLISTAWNLNFFRLYWYRFGHEEFHQCAQRSLGFQHNPNTCNTFDLSFLERFVIRRRFISEKLRRSERSLFTRRFTNRRR